MPLSRHRVANEYSLGSRDLYKGADQHDPEAVLHGVAMAGLVGVLRQLGDLAELSAQVFHGLYDEVMTASARSHGLVLRVQQLEAELTLIEQDFCQRDYLYVAANRGVDLHANPRVDHGVVTRGDTPRFIMEAIKQCHGPPRLFMLDKYDIGGEGTCMKRYTDPAFFKTDYACSSTLQEGIQRERRPLRAMVIRPNLQNFEIFRPPDEVNNDSKFEIGLSGEASDEIPTRRQLLKYRQLNGSVFRSLKPQIQNLYEKASSEEKPCMDQSEVQISFTDSPDTTAEERDIMVDTSSSMDRCNNGHRTTVHKSRSMSEGALSRSSDAMSAGSSKGYNSEVDIYVDALTTVGSEVETDSESRDNGQRAFAPVVSGKTCSDAHGEREDLPMPCSSDAGSADGDKGDHCEENATVSVPQGTPVGEHERTSSLEELFAQEKPVSCEHERTNSLEELLRGDGLVSEPDTRDSVKRNINRIPDDTVASTKNAKDNSIATISLKKTASRRSNYVGGMELFASKVGILPRKLSKKHDPFSDSLRNMAKELLELKCDGTQLTDLYDFEANVEEFNKCLELPQCPVQKEDSVRQSVSSDSPQQKEDSVRQSVSSDSPQDDVSSRECHPEEVNQDSDHDVPSSDSPQDCFHDDNVLQHANIVYLTDITSPVPQEEECDVAAPDEKSSAATFDHASKLIPEQIEDVYTKIVYENACDTYTCEVLKEVCICEEQVNAENAEECGESDEYASDDENTECIEEQVVPDCLISSLISSDQFDDTCRITPHSLTDDKVEHEGANYSPEMEHITLMETITETDLPTVETDLLIKSEAAVPDSEQYNAHPETSFAKDGALGRCEIISQNKEVQLCSLFVMDSTPDLIGNPEEIHQPVCQEPCNINNAECFGDPLSPDSRDLPLPNISSFDWMLKGVMLESMNVLPDKQTYGTLQVSGSSEDTGDAPLPPLPPMQWRTTKLQTGSTALFAKLGRPPRPKPPVKQLESVSNSSLDETNEEAEKLQERTQYNGFIHQKDAQPAFSNEVQTNSLLDMHGQENHHQEGYKEYNVQASNMFSVSEVKSVSDIASVEGDKHTLKLSELIVIPEKTWSEFVDIKPIPQQEKEQKQELINGFCDYNGNNTSGLSAERTNLEHVRCNQKEKEFSVADRNTVTDSEESKPNGLPCQDDAQAPDLPVQQEYVKHGLSEYCDKEKDFHSALEEELAKLAPNPVPEPPRYPLLHVTSHDRSMLRKAPTVVQPSSSDEKNTMLEQIKNKSFSLKPVLAKRPNVMGGPRTNLQVVAILERANAIRQAVADDDDEDSWSE